MQNTHIISNFLTADHLRAIRNELVEDIFRDGGSTAMGMALSVKNNLQADRERIPQVYKLLQGIFHKHTGLSKLAMPKYISPLIISKYEVGMEYGTHTDAGVMNSGHRSDISFTLFLQDPGEYEGGELVMETSFGDQSFKLPAGSMVLYPTGGLHRVAPVTEGSRIVIVGWIESRIRDAAKREILLDLRSAHETYLDKVGHDRTADVMLKTYENLRRMWDE